MLRRPLVKIEDGANPTFLVAPGIVRDGATYAIGNFHRGDFPDWQLTDTMRRWAGRSRKNRGAKFSADVARHLQENGWRAEAEVPITKLLQQGFDQDYGDVDVLAWSEDQRRILIIECKDVQYRKTYGEVAEQLADFRGELRPDGKPDYLLRHLNRVTLIRDHLLSLSKHTGMAGHVVPESHLLFRNPVPMRYALSRMSDRVTVNFYDDLDKI